MSSSKKLKLERWDDLIDNAKPKFKPYIQKYKEDGYCLMRDVFSEEVIHDLLEGRPNPDPNGRAAKNAWLGAQEIIRANCALGGGICAERGKGRADLRLLSNTKSIFQTPLEEKGVMELLRSLCPQGKSTTENVMLSAPGSKRQVIHMDSAWRKGAHENPLPHYMTVLIPLTAQDEETGGTRIWPKTHRDPKVKITESKGYIDMIEPWLYPGDALIFDGLLSHCGMENISEDRERYFFYMAFSSKHDPNTEVT